MYYRSASKRRSVCGLAFSRTPGPSIVPLCLHFSAKFKWDGCKKEIVMLSW